MSEAPRRKGIRLPWLADDDEAGSDAADQPQNGQQPVESVAADQAATTAVEPVAPTPLEEPAASEAAEPFLQSMVDAMQHIAEQARDEAMATLAATVEERSAALRSANELRAAELRDKAEAEAVRIGDWEQGEIQRIREEGAAKVAARQNQLDAQLKANTAAGEGALSAVASRMDRFAEQMTAFFAKLSDLHDPAAFAAAVKQMPSPPALDDAPTGRAAGTSAMLKARPSWPREPEAVAAAAPAVPEPPAAVDEAPAATEPDPVAAEVVAQPAANVVVVAPPVDSATAPADGETSTQILVTGLSSFGAITSFKQSLERAGGISRVTLGLGTSGEFVFTAIHAAGFDPTSAIRSFESAAEFKTENGQLKVSVGTAA